MNCCTKPNICRKGDTAADDDTYNTIMRDKEWLLSFACPLRFIFSHSALKEGWDNPNVFQVCTLIEQKSTFTCRQKVGRGLRLPYGERTGDKDVDAVMLTAHDKFADIIAEAQKGDSIFKVWLEDTSSMEERLKVMDENNLAGAAYWKLGFETDDIWDITIKYIN